MAEVTVAGTSDFMGGTFLAAQSDLGGDDFIFVSASIMDGETLPVLWGVTLPNFSQARMEEKSREFAEKGNEIYSQT
jgi:hypothetical protein